MKRYIDVHTGQVMAGQGDVVLKSDTTGACMVIAAYDAVKKIGALANAMLLEGRLDNSRKFSALDIAAKAIDEMISDMIALGSDKKNIEVRLVAGENIHEVEYDHGYEENVKKTMDLLRERNIPFREKPQEVADFHVALDIETGNISYV